MNDKKRIEILLKVIERVYTKDPEMQKLMDVSVIDICKEENVSPEQLFFAFLCCWLNVMGYLKRKMLCAKDSLLLVVIKKKN